MSPLSGKQTSAELEGWLKEARGGSGEGLHKALDVCQEHLFAIAAEEWPAGTGREAEVKDLVHRALREVQRLLVTFEGHSERELHAWLREILLDQTFAMPGQLRQAD